MNGQVKSSLYSPQSKERNPLQAEQGHAQMKKAISSSDVSGQVALQSRSETRTLPKRINFAKPLHEINNGASFSNVRWV
jgi:hypothetical protein